MGRDARIVTMPGQAARLGPWLVQFAAHRLQGADKEPRVTPKAMAVLAQLALRPFATLTREELFESVWPNAFPTDDALTQAIAELRRALDDDPREPRYIETIPRVGYRLRVAVEWVPDPPPPVVALPPPAEPDVPLPPDQVPLAQPVTTTAHAVAKTPPPRHFAIALLLAGCGAVALYAWWEQGVRAPSPAWSADAFAQRRDAARPLSTLPGAESWPALSPDGGSVAYLGSTGADASRRELLLQSLAAPAPRLLYRPPADAQVMMPAWSPDGSRLAFQQSSAARCDLFVIPVAGGHAEAVGECGARSPGSSFVTWTPDAEALVFARAPAQAPQDPLRLHRLQLATGAVTPLPLRSAGEGADFQPRYAPDGKTLAFLHGVSPSQFELYRVDARGGDVQRVSAQGGIHGFAWTGDSQGLVVAAPQAGGYSLVELRLADGGSRSLGIADAVAPAIASLRPVLAFVRTQSALGLFDAAIAGPALPRLFPARGSDRLPRLSPDARSLAFVSDRAGAREIWIAAPQQEPRLASRLGAERVLALEWQADGGALLALLDRGGAPEVYRISAAGDAPPQHLLSDPALLDLAPTRDGQGVLLVRRSAEGARLWRHPWASGAEIDLGRCDAARALEDRGSGSIVIARAGVASLYRLLPDRAPAALPGSTERIADTAWRVRGGAVDFIRRARADEIEIVRQPFDGAPSRVLARLPQSALRQGFDSSEDGARVVVELLTRDESDVFVLDAGRMP